MDVPIMRGYMNARCCLAGVLRVCWMPACIRVQVCAQACVF